MTKEKMMDILSGKPVEEKKKLDEKAPFSHRCCHITEEQQKRLSEMAFMSDKQESCRQLSHFIGENMTDESVKAVLQGHVVCIGEVMVPLKFAILRECIAFTKDGFLTYKIFIEPHGVGLGIDNGATLKVNPWPDGVFKDGYIGLVVRERRKEIEKRVDKCVMDLFTSRPDDEIAEAILKGAEVWS